MIRFIKHQGSYLVFLLVTFVLPLALFLQFSIYELPKVQYVFLGALFVSQYVFYNEKKFHHKIEDEVTRILKEERGRTPSRKDIIKRSQLVAMYRGICIGISAVFILLIMMYYNKF